MPAVCVRGKGVYIQQGCVLVDCVRNYAVKTLLGLKHTEEPIVSVCVCVFIFFLLQYCNTHAL